MVEVFLRLGGALALTASQRAIIDWGRPVSEITHLICTTCTGSSHPGYDLFLHQQLGLGSEVERTLIHGIGCAGGLAIVRLARNICIAEEESSGRRTRVLVVALEVTSTLLRTEMESLDEEGAKGGTKPNVASTIFSDAASAMIIGSGESREHGECRSEGGMMGLFADDVSFRAEHASFDVLGCATDTVANTEDELAFHIRETGWRVSQKGSF